ncbi:substrate-binding periplasmic protein [Rugamonas sp. CCM 8940]|uniref:substrate-binding periplasmic protein n=1 Tax=Rugamonas sp. CCM 8940 TaxID=2765359 RepID=UPI0018F483C9|nr:transporter substrate-binding domain-containing protein [Rugamonas sp. CCM 8940]MBJ7309032.1 transporter substrate-binding domain-containing protein [Rugamonas sp. CCM 8940]
MKRLLPLSLLSLSLICRAAPAQDWHVYTHSSANQTALIDGKLHGKPNGGKRAYYVELMHAMLAQLDLPDRIDEVPLARGLAMLRSRDDVVLFNLDRTPEREDKFAWVGPISEESDYLYERTAAPTGIRSLADARALRVCVLNGNIHDELLAAAGLSNLYRHNNYAGCFQMLMLGRVDLVASADSGLRHKLRDARVDAAAIQATPVRISHSKGYIALSKATSAAELARWNAALATLGRNGALRKLQQQYAGGAEP